MPSRLVPSFARATLFAVLVTSLALAGAPAHAAPAAPAHRAPATGHAAAAPAALARLAERFAEPERLIRYHYMLQIPGLTEATLERDYDAKVVAPLRDICETEAPKEMKLNAWVDSPDGALAKAGVSLRLRDSRVTVQSWAPSVAALRDLDSCTVKRYELDEGANLQYAEASEITFEPSECKLDPGSATLPALLACVGSRCPGMLARLKPLVSTNPGVRVGPAAHVYTADAEPQHPSNYLLRRGAIELWFFPATKQYFVELGFAAALQDREKADAMNAEIGAKLRAAHLVSADPHSKVERYLALTAPPAPKP